MNKYDPDKLRERLCNYIDERPRYSINYWAQRIGIGQAVLDNFIHASRKTRRNTLVAIYNFLNKARV